MKVLRSSLLTAVSTLATFAVSQPAVAQQAGSATQGGSDEIVVTGQRRAQNLQDIPAAVASLSADKLRDSGVLNFEDLQHLTPGLSVVDGVNARRINIRGEGIGVSTPFQSAGVPLMIDNLFIPRGENFLRDAMFDLDHIEVFRGPQGTYAGQNSTGGAVFVTAKQPSFDGFGATIEQTVGDYDWYKTQGAMNLPINDQWAARIAFNTETRESFYTNDSGTVGPSPVAGVQVYNGSAAGAGVQSGFNAPGNVSSYSARGILHYRPNDDWDFRLRYDETHSRDDGDATQRTIPFSQNDPDLLIDPWTTHYDFPGWNRFDVQRATLNVEWSGLSWATIKSVSGYQDYRNDVGIDNDAFSPFQPLSALGYPPSALAALGATVPQQFNTFLSEDEYYYQEFDIVSKDGGPLSWVVGVDALRQNFDQHSDAYVYGYTGDGAGGRCVTGATQCQISFYNISGGTLNTSGPNAGKISATQGLSRLDYYQVHESAAVFGDMTYTIIPSVDLSAGYRYTWDKFELLDGSAVQTYLNVPGSGWTPGWYVNNSSDFQTLGGGVISPITCGGNAGAGPPAGSAPQDGCHVYGANENDLHTGRVALTWRVSPDLTTYATYSIGMKPGTYTTQFTVNGVGDQSALNVRPERVINYEAGIKADLFDRHLRANLTAFYNEYEDWQAAFRIVGTPIGRTVNIENSELYGAELELDGRFGDLSLTFNVAYLHSEIVESAATVIPNSNYGPGCPTGTSFAACPGGVAPSGAFVSGATVFLDPVGLPLNFAPELTLNFSASYDFHVLGGTLTPYFQYAYLSEQFTALYHADQDYIPEHTVMDFRLAYATGEHWRVEGFVKNLDDEVYLTNIGGGGSATPYLSTMSFGAPRQVGVRLQYTY